MATVLQPAMTLSNWTASTVDITIDSPYASGTFELRLSINEPEGLAFQYNNADRSTWVKGSTPVSRGEWAHTFSQALTGTGNNTITITGVDVNQPYVAYGWCDNGAGSTSDVALVYQTFMTAGMRRIRIAKNTQELVYGPRASKTVSGGAQSSISFPLNDIAQAGDAIIICFYYPNSPSNFLINRTPSMNSDLFTNSTGGAFRWYEYELDNWNDDGSQDTFSGDWNDQNNLPAGWAAVVLCVANGDNNYDREGLSSSASSFSTEVAGPPRLWSERLDSIIGGFTRGWDVGWCYFYVGNANTITVPPYIYEYDLNGDQPPITAVIGPEVNQNGYRAFGMLRTESGIWGNRDWIGEVRLETGSTSPTPAFWQRVWMPEPAVFSNPDFSASTWNQIIVSGDANWPYGYVYWAIYTQNPDSGGSLTLSDIKSGRDENNSTSNTATFGYSPTVTAISTNDREGAFTFTTAAVLEEKTTYWVAFFLENHERSTTDSRDAFKTNVYLQTYVTPDGPNEDVQGTTEVLELTTNPATVTQTYNPPSIVSVNPSQWQDGLTGIIITTTNVASHLFTRVWVKGKEMIVTAFGQNTLTVTASQDAELLDDTDYYLTLTDYKGLDPQVTLNNPNYLCELDNIDPFYADVVYMQDWEKWPVGDTTNTVYGVQHVAADGAFNCYAPNHTYALDEGPETVLFKQQSGTTVLRVVEDPDDCPFGTKYMEVGFSSSPPIGHAFSCLEAPFGWGTTVVNYPVCFEIWYRVTLLLNLDNGIMQCLDSTTQNGIELETYAGFLPDNQSYLRFRLWRNGSATIFNGTGNLDALVQQGIWYSTIVQRHATGKWSVWHQGTRCLSGNEPGTITFNEDRGNLFGGDGSPWGSNELEGHLKGFRITKAERYPDQDNIKPQPFYDSSPDLSQDWSSEFPGQ